jgi:multisubunit Na+/H+ antiporter MnhE subunit
MDYKGQRLSEYIYSIIIILCGAIGWLIGYQEKNFLLAFYGWAVGLIIALIVRIFIENSYIITIYFTFTYFTHSYVSPIGLCLTEIR